MLESRRLLLIVVSLTIFLILLTPGCSKTGNGGGGMQIEASIGPVIAGKINGRDYLFVAISKSNKYTFMKPDILILDLNNPAKPERLAQLEGPYDTDIDKFTLNGSVLYACTRGSLAIIDVANPAAPREMARLDDIKAYDIAISGHYAYIYEEANRIAVADISNLENPQIIGPLPFQAQQSRELLISNSRFFWRSGEGIHIMDISDPASPIELSLIQDISYRPPNTNPTAWRKVPPEEAELNRQRFIDYSVQGDTVYIASGPTGLKIFDISDPAKPRQMSIYKAIENPNSTQILTAGNRAYLFEERSTASPLSNKICVLDISDPHNPQKLKSIELSINNTYRGFAESGSYLYAYGQSPFSSRGTAPIILTPVFEIIDISSGAVTEMALR